MSQELFRTPYLTAAHYEHRIQLRSLERQQQHQRIIQASGELAVESATPPIEDTEIPFGD